MIVTDHGEGAAVLRGAKQIVVTHAVDGAVQPRPLAVPHGKDAIMGAIAKHGGLLGAKAGGRSQILVHARHEMDSALGQEAVGAP